MRKLAAIVGIILTCIGVIFSTIFWVVIVDAGGARPYPFGNPNGPIIGTVIGAGLIISMPTIIVGLPIAVHGFFARYSEKMTFITVLLAVSAYGIFWLIIALTAPD